MSRSVFEGQKFEMLSDGELPPVLRHATLRKCWFMACHYGATAAHPFQRRHIEDVQLHDCKATNNSSLGPAILENVDALNLKTSGLFITWGAVFKHVRLRGKCGRLMLSFLPSDALHRAGVGEFDQADRDFYRNVDWALDISEGEFEELDIRNVPADLIRRDPHTQVIVRLDKVESMQGTWRTLSLSDTPWAISLRNMIGWRMPDKVLVAPKRSKNFNKYLAGLRLLREAGVAEKD